jgi:propanol-preferring alcohol dehydrogenase
MKAAVMHEVGKPLAIEDVPVPEIGAEEVLVETHSCGICGTDLHILKGFGYVPPLPHILGHEPAGIVEALGTKVTGLKPGDHVVPHLFFNCGHCYYCRIGRQQQCIQLKGILGVLVPGAFAEYFKWPAANLYKLSDEVPFDMGGLLADAIVTSVHAVKRSGLQVGGTAVVLGAGGIGVILVQLLKAAGIRTAAVSRRDESLQLASENGADLIAKLGTQDAVQKIRDFTNGLGVQCAFDCVGTAQTMRYSADYVMRCGRIIVIGEERDNPLIDTTEIAQKELEIMGSRNGTRQDTVEAIRLLETGVVRPVIGRRFPLAEINAAFDFMRQGAVGRVVITVKE